jgi:hypothetical protein
MNPDTITILRSRGRRLAKLLLPDGTAQGYDNAKSFDIFVRPVRDLDALAYLLGRLLRRPDCMIVRGGITDPARTSGVRRLVHPDARTGEPPTLREQSHQWLALDLDGLPLPAGIDARDLMACATAARAALPPAFHAARAVVTASASHRIKPGLRLRYWCWCDRAVSGPELHRWLRGAPVDGSVFLPAQPIYTAAPIFADGAADPLPVRIALLAGTTAEVTVPAPAALQPPPPRRPAPLPRPTDAKASRYAFAALRGATVRVAAAPVSCRHRTMLREARGLTRFIGAGLLTQRDVRDALGGAAEQAGKTKDEAEAVIDWALLHPSASPLPEGAS